LANQISQGFFPRNVDNFQHGGIFVVDLWTLLQALPIILANLVTLIFNGIILSLKIRYKS